MDNATDTALQKEITPPTGDATNASAVAPAIAVDKSNNGSAGAQTLSQSKENEASQNEQEKKQKPKRTKGLKIFDFLLYPVFTNVIVFFISVAATYFTTVGGKPVMRPDGKKALKIDGKKTWQRHESGPDAGKLIHDGTGGGIGKFLFRRKDGFARFLHKHFGWEDHVTDVINLVGWSFIDGSLLAPVVKLFEDKREKIGKWIDKKLGTLPADEEAAYAAEPKQSWKSVFLGRIATFSIVFPVAIALFHIKFPKPDVQSPTLKKVTNFFFTPKAPPGHPADMNEILFYNPGLAAGRAVDARPGLARFFKVFGKNTNMRELFKIGFFEAFYTSVCTAGLYFWSRLIASKGKKHTHENKTMTTLDSLHKDEDSKKLSTEKNEIEKKDIAMVSPTAAQETATGNNKHSAAFSKNDSYVQAAVKEQNDAVLNSGISVGAR